jgi:hypothetical protein
VKLFDVAAARAEIEGRPRATRAIRAIPTPPNSTSSTNSTPPALETAPRADGLDADALLAFLRLHGPATYGAAASSLGWGATRAWQAEDRLRRAGLATVTGPLGQAVPQSGTP